MAFVQLPSALVLDVTEVIGAGFHVVNAIPDSGETGVALESEIEFEVYNASGSAPAAVDVTVEVAGVVALAAGAPMAGWGASSTTPDASTRRFVLTPPAPLGSGVPIEVEVTVAGTPATTHAYTFTTIDIVAPRTLSAVARGKKVVRVTFSEAMRQLDATAVGDALNADHYLIDRVTRPAVSLEVVAVEPVSATEVDLLLDIEMTFGAGYELTVSGLLDVAGNAHVVAPDNFVSFTGFLPPYPEGRRFLLTDFIPSMNLAEDTTGDLAMFLGCIQEVLNVLLCDVDEWGRILDPDIAPEAFVDAMLADLGNPFTTFDLAEADKRRLLRELVRLYQLKGTEPGMLAAILFFTGLTVTVRTYSGSGFVIGTNTLSKFGTLSTAFGILGPNQAGLYSFKIVSAVDLTETQRAQIGVLADYMRGSHEHYLGTVEPTTSAPPTHVVLGWSRLGGTSAPGNWVLNG